MKATFMIVIFLVCGAVHGTAQIHRYTTTCKPDTVNIDHWNIKTGDREVYRAVSCSESYFIGVRVEAGSSRFSYTQRTKNWTGNHNAAVVGLAIVYGHFTVGAKFKLASVRPKYSLNFDGVIIGNEAVVNPTKWDLDVGYSFDLKYNFSLESYLALTSNNFILLNKEDSELTHSIGKTNAWTVGCTINKYFRIKNFEYFGLFVRYGYGFSDFRKIHTGLGKGFSEISLGVMYKGFLNHVFYKKI